AAKDTALDTASQICSVYEVPRFWRSTPCASSFGKPTRRAVGLARQVHVSMLLQMLAQASDMRMVQESDVCYPWLGAGQGVVQGVGRRRGWLSATLLCVS
ncbi:unnamed protein product, partial [Durusdinium trenchii]